MINRAGGSIKGEDNQKAITADNGTPKANILAINGITSHEQKGARPPTNVSIKIVLTSFPLNAFETKLSAPVAFK